MYDKQGFILVEALLLLTICIMLVTLCLYGAQAIHTLWKEGIQYENQAAMQEAYRVYID